MEVNVENLGSIGREIVARARRGEPIVLSENGKTQVTLAATEVVTSRRGLGGRDSEKGRFRVPDDFNDLPEEILRDFEG